MEQLSIDRTSQFKALLSDEVVMQWLMDLEAEHADVHADVHADDRVDAEGRH